MLVSSSSRSRSAAARCSSIVASSSSDFRRHLGLDVSDALAHALLERGDRALEGVLGSLEVGLPGSQSLLDALLDGRDELGHALRELPLADGELAAALVGEPALLRDVRRERVGLSARDRDAELLGLRRGLLLGRGANRATRLGDELLGACRASARASQAQEEHDAQENRGDERCERGSRPGSSRRDSRFEMRREPPRARRTQPRGAAARAPPPR